MNIIVPIQWVSTGTHLSITRAIFFDVFAVAWTVSATAQTSAANEQSAVDNEAGADVSKQVANPLSNLWLIADRVTFPVGLQVGKLTRLGHMPVKFDVQGQYYAVHQQVYGPKWNLQLQVAPIIPSLIRGRYFEFLSSNDEICSHTAKRELTEKT